MVSSRSAWDPLAKVRIACSTSGFCVSSSDELSSAMIAVAAPSSLRKVGTKSCPCAARHGGVDLSLRGALGNEAPHLETAGFWINPLKVDKLVTSVTNGCALTMARSARRRLMPCGARVERLRCRSTGRVRPKDLSHLVVDWRGEPLDHVERAVRISTWLPSAAAAAVRLNIKPSCLSRCRSMK